MQIHSTDGQVWSLEVIDGELSIHYLPDADSPYRQIIPIEPAILERFAAALRVPAKIHDRNQADFAFQGVH